MDQDDFGIVLTKQDYDSLEAYKKESQLLNKQIQSFKQQNATLEENVKHFKKSLMVKEEQLKYILQLVQDWIRKSQHKEQSIQQFDNNQSVYENLIDMNNKGLATIELLQLHTVWGNKYKQLAQGMDNLVVQDRTSKSPKPSSVVKNKAQQQNTELVKIIEQMDKELHGMKQENLKIKKNNKELNDKVLKLSAKSKVQKVNADKSYLIKLLIDEYAKQLETNLNKMEGIRRNQIQTVMSNELEGITVYIDTLIRKMKTN